MVGSNSRKGGDTMSTIENVNDRYDRKKLVETITIRPCPHDVAIDMNLSWDRAQAEKDEEVTACK